jgi:hypothetical protein
VPEISHSSAAPGSRNGKAPARDSIQEYDMFPTHSIIIEENEDLESSQHNMAHHEQLSSNPLNSSTATIRPTLRRSASHESLISIRGMDIHTLNSRPSQLLLGKYVATTLPSASVVAAITDESAFGTRASASTSASNSASTSTSKPQTQERGGRSSSQTYLSDIAAQHGRALSRKPSRPSLPGRVGGWVWSKWGSVASATTSNTENESVSSATSSMVNVDSLSQLVPASSRSTSDSTNAINDATTPMATPAAVKIPVDNITVSPRMVLLMRPSGVNQSGPIWGFPPEKKLDKIPLIKGLDVDALRDGLTEG